MQRASWLMLSLSSLGLLTSVIGCGGVDPSTAADQLTTLAANLLLQLLAAFLL